MFYRNIRKVSSDLRKFSNWSFLFLQQQKMDEILFLLSSFPTDRSKQKLI